MRLGGLVFVAVLAVGAAAQSTSEIDGVIARVKEPLEGDREVMAKAGDRAFQRLLPVAVRVFKACQSEAARDNHQDELDNLSDYLTLCAGPRRTAEMTAVWRLADGQPRFRIFSWLAETGDVTQNRALFDKALMDESGGFPANWERLDSVNALCRAADRKAIDSVVKAMRSTADRDLRKYAFWRVAATGDSVALKAVKALRDRGRTLPPLASRSVVRPAEGETVKSSFFDGDGTKWGLFGWDGLGSSDDLWFARWSGRAWVDPVFTGVTTYWPHYLPGGGPVEGYEVHDAEVAAMVDKGGWKKLVGDPTAAKDTDGDGYTDVVEEWLGLDPAKADTDGDGIPDGTDKNPVVASRALDESDRAMAAALSVYTVGETRTQIDTIVEFPEKVRPFEVESAAGLVLPRTPERKPKGSLFGIRISVSKAPVFAKDGRSADVEMVEDGGYYMNGVTVTVRLIGGEWYAVGIQSKWNAIS